MAESSGRSVLFGLMGRAYPPMDDILGTMPRAEAQGWDFINYPDQIPGLFPEGSVPLSASPADDPTLPVSSMTNIWMGSFEMITAAWGGPEKVANRLQEFVDAGLNELTIVNTVSYVDPEFGHKFPALISEVMTRMGHAPLKLEMKAS